MFTAKTMLILTEFSNREKMQCPLHQQLIELAMQMEFMLTHD